MINKVKTILLSEKGMFTVESLICLAAVSIIALSIVSQLLPPLRDLYQRIQLGVQGVSETGF